MRKLREAAVVAALLGSVSMLGAGIASAGDVEQELPTVNCEQDASTNTSTTTIAGTITVTPTTNGGDADASATQQVCGIENEENENTAGTATGGIGTDIIG
ncbi:MAG TPA: hypothetical protein VNS49_02725 [Streptomyces sp.]|nr:hypothetical protein [Streptomyces sp.]